MNPREHLHKMVLPAEGDRIKGIIEREGGSRIKDEITVKCCDLEFTGPSEIALGLAAEHRRKAHPHTVKKRRFIPPKERQAMARESGNRASRGD